ncbi:MAG: glycosyltransferase family 4 protein [Bacteroidota bacterium]|nr:glycosyltransferase family 4 protein [Bacteroidota bacterium]
MIKTGVIGTRGFPEIQGGLETHCMELYTRLARLDDNLITVYRRKPYISAKNRDITYPNIRFLDLNVPKSKNFETFFHSLLATVHALFQKYDIVHFHNTGPGFFIPLLKFSGAKIVFTYHNISYTQKKWGSFARHYLELSERICLKNADYVIFISEVLKSEMTKKYSIAKWKIISNGVNMNPRSENTDYIESLGLEKNKYIIGVGRFLEEKGFDYLIRAFVKAELQGYKLVIVGDTDYPTDYSNRLRAFARDKGIVLTGFIKGDNLRQVYSFARLFVIPSFSEGHPIALLEAMSYNIEVLASDIPANLQIKLEKDDYFRVGDEDDLKDKIVAKLSGKGRKDYIGFLTERYSWDKIAEETNNIYNKLKFSNET